MPTSPIDGVIEHLRRAVLRDGDGPGDGELLGHFVERRDEAALAALVERHGPLVWGVCRRLLSHHDAEDAFQATFLVLVRKAASVVPRETLGNWLYGVAHRTALQARRTAARRGSREAQVKAMPETPDEPHDQWPEVEPLLDQELSRLPEIYRAVIVFCDLEGRTRKEVARRLGVPEGTVAGRLARARGMLAKRLTARGVTLSAGGLAAVLMRNVASAGVPDAVMSSTIEVARFVAAGRVAAAGPVSVKVAALTEGVLKAMLMNKLRAVVAVVLVLGLVTTGATILTRRTPAAAAATQDDKKPVAEKSAPMSQKGEKLAKGIEEKLKWGEPADGLRAALVIRAIPGWRMPGDKPDLFLVVQNTSKAPLRFINTNEAEEPGMLDLRGDGMIKWRVTFKWPTRVDVLLQPGEVAFLPLFDLNPKVGPRVGWTIAEDVLKLPRYSLVAHMNVEKAPAGAWAGKLVTGDTSGAAAEIRAEPPPATAEKK
jgi:RNA polymerase sigma factor (sigma-70 family)